MAKLQFGHPNSIGSYESLISVRFKSRNRSSGHPTRYL
ncbi:hypothetical protein LINPERHAP1_LOCUS10618 [Linum perenne]